MGTASRAQRLASASIGQRQRHSGGRLQTDETKLQRHSRAMRPTPYTLYSLRAGRRALLCGELESARVKKGYFAAGTPTNTRVISWGDKPRPYSARIGQQGQAATAERTTRARRGRRGRRGRGAAELSARSWALKARVPMHRVHCHRGDSNLAQGGPSLFMAARWAPRRGVPRRQRRGRKRTSTLRTIG